METLLQHHFETQIEVDATAAEVFDFLDDHRRLSAHMTKSSWMMAGSRMTIDMDEKQGRAAGSKITLSGKIIGLSLNVEEVVTEYDHPNSKAWETIGSPRLLVIGSYRMGFSLSSRQGGSLLRVFIDYSLPSQGVSRFLGRVFGKSYARWCTNRMARDAIMHFQTHRGSL
jgi:hypothetical protein